MKKNIRCQLTGIEGLYKEKNFDLSKDTIIIGRDKECDIPLDDKKTSRKHARLEWNNPHYWIQDLKSTNGIFVNGFPVNRSRLKDGDKVVIGGTVFILNDKMAPLKCKDPSGAVLIDESIPLETRNTIFFTPKKAREIITRHKELERDELERNYEQYAVMLKIANALGSSFALSDILEKIMKEVFSIFPVDRGVIMLFDEKLGEYTPKVVWTRDKKKSQEIVISKTLIDRVINEKQAVSTSDIRSETLFTKSESILFSAIKSVMCVPIICRDEVLGLIQVDTKTSLHDFQ